MPGGLERQNAFSEYYGSKTFTELHCHICKQYESDGDWIKIQCKCNATTAFTEYVYTHRHCLKMSGKCKQCSQLYIQQTTSKPATAATAVFAALERSHYTRIMLEFMRKYRAQLALLICCIIGLSIFYEALDCITIDLLVGDELQGLTDADFLYLPVWEWSIAFSQDT